MFENKNVSIVIFTGAINVDKIYLLVIKINVKSKNIQNTDI